MEKDSQSVRTWRHYLATYEKLLAAWDNFRKTGSAEAAVRLDQAEARANQEGASLFDNEWLHGWVMVYGEPNVHFLELETFNEIAVQTGHSAFEFTEN